MWSWWEPWEQERSRAGCWSVLSGAGQVVGGELWKGCCHFLSLSRGNGKFWLRCGQGMSKTLLCCLNCLAPELQPLLWRQLKSVQSWAVQAPWRWDMLRACSAPKGKDAPLQCWAGGRRVLEAHGTGCSLATRGLSSLWVAFVVSWCSAVLSQCSWSN